MKIYLMISLLFFITQYSMGQDLDVQRRLLKLNSNQNCTVERLKKNNKGEIFRLEQVVLEQQKDTLIRTAESYKKNKYWKIWITRDIIHAEAKPIKEPEDYYVIKEIDETMQELDQNGNIMYEFFYIAGVPKSTYLSYSYYPNGQLKLIAEMKDEKLWNILVFKNIDGRTHDYGNYKNGSGKIYWLDDKGESCLECFFENNQVIKEIDDCN